MGNPQRKFAKIYDKYVEKIYRYIFLKVGRPETAEDLTSQVFTKGWKRISKVKKNPPDQAEIKNIPAYLYQIARAELSDYYRSETKFKTVSIDDIQVADPQPDPEDIQQLRADVLEIKNCLVKLAPEHQDILIWRYVDGYSNKEIAEILEKSRGAVRVMVHRALKELREKLKRRNE